MSSTQYCIANLYFEEVAKLSGNLRKRLDEAIGLLHRMAIKMKLKFNIY